MKNAMNLYFFKLSEFLQTIFAASLPSKIIYFIDYCRFKITAVELGIIPCLTVFSPATFFSALNIVVNIEKFRSSEQFSVTPGCEDVILNFKAWNTKIFSRDNIFFC